MTFIIKLYLENGEKQHSPDFTAKKCLKYVKEIESNGGVFIILKNEDGELTEIYKSVLEVEAHWS